MLKENVAYKLSYRDNYSVGTAYVTITGIGDYKGSVTKSFAITEPVLTSDVIVQSRNAATGTFDIVVDGVPSYVTSVSVPVWTKADQSDIVWYNASRVDADTFIVHANIANHKNNVGVYNIHVYVSGGGYKMRCAYATTTVFGAGYERVFDLNYYIKNNPDVAKAFGGNTEAIFAHFVNNGEAEGRQAIANFNVASYRARYADLRSAFGNNLKAYYDHYRINGYAEGRVATGSTELQNPTTVYNGVDYKLVYDYNYYINKYPDIKAAFNGDENATLRHFVECGMNEGRQGKASFNVAAYRANYADLRSAFGRNLKAYYMHYIGSGYREGRKATGNGVLKNPVTVYNGEDFTGKGHSYHADTPEDLFYRMHLTMELGENLTEELGRKIAIFSFPMRYIPLDNDQRGFIGANWNAKYLRALQCMLIPTQGKGIQGRSFFEADFGKTAEDFVMYLAMPERLLNKRGHFVERKDEPKFEREIRYTQWSENRHLIDTWMKYYSMFEKDTVLEYIGCNRFSVETLDKIENEELKKLYFLYLTPSATIRVFSDCTEDTKRIISTFILEELPFMYSRIVETILSSKPGYKVIAGILENFGEKVCTDLLKKIDLFSGHDNDKLTMLIKANKSKRLVDFDFSLLQFIPYFHVSNLLSKQEEQIIMNSAYELKEAPIRKILLLHLDELKDVLIKTNGAQPGDTQIISVIEEQIKELYHQISIFEL